jgi:UDP-N-acetylglucosamine 2-epimerase
MQEELNRRLIDHLSSLLLPVSPNCSDLLTNEGMTGDIEITGDPQYDVFAKVAPLCTQFESRDLKGFVTIHRSENVDNPDFLPRFVIALATTALQTGIEFIWPVHPRTKSSLLRLRASDIDLTGITFVEPMSYAETLRHLADSKICITDSGGVQKEAFWLRVPCLTIRPSTEWVETIEARANVLVPDVTRLGFEVARSLESCGDVRWTPDPYGGIGSAKRTANAISKWLSHSTKVVESISTMHQPSKKGYSQ